MMNRNVVFESVTFCSQPRLNSVIPSTGIPVFRAPPRESPRGQPCGGGALNRRCGSGKKRSQDEAVHPATDFLLIFGSAAALFCIFHAAIAFLDILL